MFFGIFGKKKMSEKTSSTTTFINNEVFKMEAGVILSSSSPIAAPADTSILQDALLLNSDIGRHSVKCKFSTRLTGRFYQDGSLERSTFRKSRLVEMQARKRRLESELQLEERRVSLLEKRLDETERARESAHDLIFTIERGLVQFQTFVRRKHALKLYRAMRHELFMRKSIARFFQCRYRGWRGRACATSRREYVKQQQRENSAAYIQASVRRRIQRRYYLDLLSERERLSNQSAAAIQAILRGKVTREMYQTEMKRRHDATSHIQRVWRGVAGRMVAENLRQELRRKRMEAEKPKRVPLHLRRYSTYGSSANTATNTTAAKRNGGPKKRDARMRRRSSDAMIVMNKDGRLSSLTTNLRGASSSVGDADENDSIATTITSLTNQTNGTTENSSSRRRRRVTTQQQHRRSTNLWPSPQRVLAAKHKRNTTLQPCNKVNAARGGTTLERRKTVSGGRMTTTKTTTIAPPPLVEKEPVLQTCCNDDSTQSSSDEDGDNSDDDDVNQIVVAAAAACCSRGGTQQSKAKDCLKDEGNAAATVEEDSNIPSREGISTPILVSSEASLIVQEVLGKTILCHNIIHSTFEDEVNEHEDDLQ